MTDAELLAEIILYIKSGNRNTMAAGLRQVLNDFVATKQNINEKGIALGYAPLNSTANLDATLLAIASPKLYAFLRDDGTFASPDAVFSHGDGSVALDDRYNFFEFTGVSGTWAFVRIRGNRIFWIVNRGSGTLTVNSNNGDPDFLLLSGGSAINSFTVSAGTYTVVIDDGNRFIVVPQSSGSGPAYTGTGGEVTVTGTVIGLDAPLATSLTDAKIKGSVGATAGLIVFGDGNADTVTTDVRHAIDPGRTVTIATAVNGVAAYVVDNSNSGNSALSASRFINSAGQSGYIGKGSVNYTDGAIGNSDFFMQNNDPSGNICLKNDGLDIVFASRGTTTPQVVMSGDVLKYKNQYSTSAAPSITAGAGAGTSPTISLVSGSTNDCGTVNLTTGTLPSINSTVFVLIFTGFTAPNGAQLVITANDAATCAVMAATPSYTVGLTGNAAFKIITTALPAATSLTFGYTIKYF